MLQNSAGKMPLNLTNSGCKQIVPENESSFGSAVWCLLVACCLFLSGCQNESNELTAEFQPSQPVTVNAIAVKRVARTTTTSTYFGSLQPNRERVLRFDRAGTVATIAKAGRTFKSGDVLADLKVDGQQEQKTQLENRIQLARNNGQITQAEQLEAQLRQLNAQTTAGQIEAPFSGIVSSVFLSSDSATNAGAPALKIVDLVDPKVQINLPRRFANWIERESLQITFLIDGSPFQGTLDRKSVTQNPAGSTTVWFTVSGNVADNAWTFGQNVEARFDFDEPNSGFWLPLSAVQRAGPGLWSVLVVNYQANEQDDVRRLQKRIVEVKKFADDQVFVDGNLADNEYVVSDGRHRVVPNQQVQVNPRPFRTADQSGAGP